MMSLDFSDLVDRANSDPEFPRAARYWDTNVEFVIGDSSTVLRLSDGHLELGDADTKLGDHDVRIAAAEEDWRKLLAPIPPPGWHDLYNAKTVTVTADVLDLGPYYLAVRRLIELLSEQLHGPRRESVVARTTRTYDDAVGRYVYFDVQGSQHRVYYEETGQGIPLVLLHTAGADGRQWRHLLESRKIQQHYRLIAVDLPYHGKSLPPTDVEWWREEYLLTREFLLDFFDGFCEALDLDRPVFMGCSVGGMLAPDLAYYRPAKYRAVVALNGALALQPANLAAPTKVRSWHHPRISNEWKASSMLGFMAPSSPEVFRRETAWVYSQGSPPVFAGDIHYYMNDHTLTAEEAGTIDTSKTGVYVLTGEYDPLALNGSSQLLADAVEGCHFEMNTGIGHFGPSENPEVFLELVWPVLDEIAQKYPH
jgi:pimeloyl-ACP methyl ester carboxylesterase